MSQSLESLLQPSLTGRKLTRPMYSISSHVLVAFFGGPVGLLLFSLNNMRYTHLLSKWWRFYLFFFVAVAASQYFISLWSLQGFPAWMPLDTHSSSNIRLVNRLFALTLMAVLYWAQKSLFNISQLKGDSPNPWVAGILCGLVGIGASLIFMTGAAIYA